MGVGNQVLLVFILSGPGKVLTSKFNSAFVRHLVCPGAEDTKMSEKMD